MGAANLIIKSLAVLTFLAAPFFFTDNASLVVATSLALVAGGSIVSGFLIYGVTELSIPLMKSLRHATSRSPVQTRMRIRDLLKAHRAYQKDHVMTPALGVAQTGFFAEAIRLATEKVFALPQMNQILEERIKTLYREDMNHAETLYKLSRLPVVWGLVAAFVALMAHSQLRVLESPTNEYHFVFSAGIYSMIFGLFLGYLVLVPMADALVRRAEQQRQENRLIAVGISTVLQKSNPIVMFEKLNALVEPEHQAHWDDVVADWESEAA